MLSPDQLERRNYFFNLLCKHTVKVKPKTGSDAYGKVTYGSEVDYQARVEDTNRLVQAANGQMMAATGKIVFAFPPPVIDLQDQIRVPTLDTVHHPDGYMKVGQIIDIKQDPTGAGQQPTVVYY